MALTLATDLMVPFDYPKNMRHEVVRITNHRYNSEKTLETEVPIIVHCFQMYTKVKYVDGSTEWIDAHAEMERVPASLIQVASTCTDKTKALSMQVYKQSQLDEQGKPLKALPRRLIDPKKKNSKKRHGGGGGGGYGGGGGDGGRSSALKGRSSALSTMLRFLHCSPCQ